MKKMKIIALSLFVLTTAFVISGLTKSTTSDEKSEVIEVEKNKQNQTINLFVTHGHCSTPFTGVVENLKVGTSEREDMGNPLEDMTISFEIDPNSFNICRMGAEDLMKKIRAPGLFIKEKGEKITFQSTTVYTIGLDWYQVNGEMSIKGEVKNVMLFVTGIRDPKDSMASSLVLEGQLNLFDWGIDYDKIVNGKSDPVPTEWMYINMRIDLPK